MIGFDGPGQGGALRQGIYFEHAWEKPAKAILDHFRLDAVDWLGASCGGYLALRAAAFEPRIKHVISLPATYWGLDMTLKQMTPGKAQQLVSLFMAGDRANVEALVAEQRTPDSVFDWCVTQGMHITGTKTPFDFLTAIAQHSLEGVLHHVKQDVLLTEGEQDHLFVVFPDGCADRAASLGRRLDDRDVAHAGERQVQRAWNRCRAERQHVDLEAQ